MLAGRRAQSLQVDLVSDFAPHETSWAFFFLALGCFWICRRGAFKSYDKSGDFTDLIYPKYGRPRWHAFFNKSIGDRRLDLGGTTTVNPKGIR